MKAGYQIKIGKDVYVITVKARKEGDKIFFDAPDLIYQQKKLALTLVTNPNTLKTPDLFNFLVNTSGLKAKYIAAAADVEPSNISQWRRDKTMSDGAWTCFRILFKDFFTHEKITNTILRGNIEEILGKKAS